MFVYNFYSLSIFSNQSDISVMMEQYSFIAPYFTGTLQRNNLRPYFPFAGQVQLTSKQGKKCTYQMQDSNTYKQYVSNDNEQKGLYSKFFWLLLTYFLGENFQSFFLSFCSAYVVSYLWNFLSDDWNSNPTVNMKSAAIFSSMVFGFGLTYNIVYYLLSTCRCKKRSDRYRHRQDKTCFMKLMIIYCNYLSYIQMCEVENLFRIGATQPVSRTYNLLLTVPNPKDESKTTEPERTLDNPDLENIVGPNDDEALMDGRFLNRDDSYIGTILEAGTLCVNFNFRSPRHFFTSFIGLIYNMLVLINAIEFFGSISVFFITGSTGSFNSLPVKINLWMINTFHTLFFGNSLISGIAKTALLDMDHSQWEISQFDNNNSNPEVARNNPKTIPFVPFDVVLPKYNKCQKGIFSIIITVLHCIKLLPVILLTMGIESDISIIFSTMFAAFDGMKWFISVYGQHERNYKIFNHEKHIKNKRPITPKPRRAILPIERRNINSPKNRNGTKSFTLANEVPRNVVCMRLGCCNMCTMCFGSMFPCLGKPPKKTRDKQIKKKRQKKANDAGGL